MLELLPICVGSADESTMARMMIGGLERSIRVIPVAMNIIRPTQSLMGRSPKVGIISHKPM